MKGLLLISLIVTGILSNLNAQSSYMTREGTISFFSSAPLEDIKAINSRVQAVLDNSTGEIAVRMRIEDFEFEKSLMQRHFNENYMESHIYPEARLAGSVEGFEEIRDGSANADVTVKGSLTIHGVTREVEIPGTISRQGPHLICNAVFDIRLEDYDVRIPRLLTRNIAESVEVTVNLRLDPVN
jgi:hypothetical protein